MTKPDLSIDTDKSAHLKLSDQIDVLTMSPAQSKKLLKMMLSDVRAKARHNVATQTTITGEKFKPRTKRAKNRRRMLRGLSRQLSIMPKSSHYGEVGWKVGFTAMLGRVHQDGMVTTKTPAKAGKKPWFSKDYYKKPVTPGLAKALNRNGFKLRVARKRGKGGAVLKRVSTKWLQGQNEEGKNNMSFGRGAFILRVLLYGKRKKPKKWKVKVPARPFLGVTPENADAYLTEIAQEALAKIRSK